MTDTARAVKLGYAFCASHCTIGRSISAMEKLLNSGYDVQPIMSAAARYTDTRFGRAEDIAARIEELTGKKIISDIASAEPLGPKMPLDALVIAPCTGNTLAKLANGITDTAVTMAAKAHLRSDKPTLIALATNDALSQNLKNIAALLARKRVFFVPMAQDDPIGKPHSLVADFEKIPEALASALTEKQLRPLFI